MHAIAALRAECRNFLSFDLYGLSNESEHIRNYELKTPAPSDPNSTPRTPQPKRIPSTAATLTRGILNGNYGRYLNE